MIILLCTIEYPMDGTSCKLFFVGSNLSCKHWSRPRKWRRLQGAEGHFPLILCSRQTEFCSAVEQLRGTSSQTSQITIKPIRKWLLLSAPTRISKSYFYHFLTCLGLGETVCYFQAAPWLGPGRGWRPCAAMAGTRWPAW